jgi:hypothetical protein
MANRLKDFANCCMCQHCEGSRSTYTWRFGALHLISQHNTYSASPLTRWEVADFQCPTLKAVDAMVAGFWLQGHCSWLRSLTNYFSPWSLRILYPQSRALFDRLEVCGLILLSLWGADDATRVYKIALIRFWLTILAKAIEEITFHCLQH